MSVEAPGGDDTDDPGIPSAPTRCADVLRRTTKAARPSEDLARVAEQKRQDGRHDDGAPTKTSTFRISLSEVRSGVRTTMAIDTLRARMSV
jgi:hypothetical protein